MNFSNITNWVIPEGVVKQVTDSLGILIWQKPTPTGYFYVEDISGSNNTLNIQKAVPTAPTIEVFYSTDQQNWTSMGSTSTTPITVTVPANSKLYLKATTNCWCNSSNMNQYNSINATGGFNIGGNIMSLLVGDNFINSTLASNNVFRYLFTNSNVVNANSLILPSNTTLYCYQYMFQGCTRLTTAPTLPATTLANYCYAYMFGGCTSLTTTPELPATTLIYACYAHMFDGCTSLNSVTTYADDISATNCLNDWLNNVAQTGNFNNLGNPAPMYPSGASGIPTGWTEHRQPPTAEYFYVEDISGSASTLTIKKIKSSSPAITVYKSSDSINWVSMGTTDTTGITATVPANGKLYLKATTNYWATSETYYNQISCSGDFNIGGCIMSLLRGDYYENSTLSTTNSYAFASIFRAVTTLKSAENLILPSNTYTNCYVSMFYGSGVTKAPALPATTLTQGCYNNMFYSWQ